MSGVAFDNIIIGGGLSGLLNAIFSSASGKRVMIITKGAGSLTIGSGLIDVLGYTYGGGIIKKPLDGLSALEPEHPYTKCGDEIVAKSIGAFIDICERYGYFYLPSVNNRWVPTSLGRLKPSFLVPATMSLDNLKNKETIYVAGIEGMKDFSPEIICDNFSSMDYFKGKKFIPVSVPLREQGFRDFSVLDMARFMDSDEGCSRFIGVMKGKVSTDCGLIVPPILGSRPDYKVFNRIRTELKTEICESVTIPPAVTGYRLRTMLLDVLKNAGVEIIENAPVVSAEVKNGKCISVNTLGASGLRSYKAENFTVATGGFYGGGISSTSTKIFEPIFNIDIKASGAWCSSDYKNSQEYSKFGVNVNTDLKHVDPSGKIIYDNVYFIGRILAGADSPSEHSGNGIALATAYLGASRL